MRKLLLTAFITAVALLAPALTAHAAEAGGAYVYKVDYRGGTVGLAARHDSTVSKVGLFQGSSMLASAPCLPGSAETTLAPYRLRARVTLRVVALDVAGAELWESTITLDPVTYRPRKPVLRVAWGKVVPSKFTFTGGALRPLTQVRARERETDRTTTMSPWAGNTGSFTFRSLGVPYGQATFDVVAKNGFGSSPKATMRVYNLGANLPKATRYELVCKRTLWMFDVYRGRVIHAWPVAIGTPQTPTPTGYFRIGPAAPASGAWGVLRRRLTRVGSGPTRFYIHGTNAPWSIGLQASHGCVRMYNYHVRQFARVVPNNTLVRIR